MSVSPNSTQTHTTQTMSPKYQYNLEAVSKLESQASLQSFYWIKIYKPYNSISSPSDEHAYQKLGSTIQEIFNNNVL